MSSENSDAPVNNLLTVSSTDDSIANCHLVGLMPYYDDSTKLYEHALAMDLAIKHLNEGDGSLVKEVEGLNERCQNIEFSNSVIDSTFSQTEAFRAVDELTRDISAATTTIRPCGFVGAQFSYLTKTTAILTGLRGYPQLSPAATTTALNDKGEYPLFGRTVPDDGTMAEAYVRFFHSALNIRHVFVIVENDPYTLSILKSMRDAIRKLGYAPGADGAEDDFFYLEERLVEGGRLMDETKRLEELSGAIDDLRASEFRFVVALTGGSYMADPMMEIAYDQGLAGNGDFHWWFFEGLGDLNNTKLERDSKLHKAYEGVGYIYYNPERTGKRYEEFTKQSRAIKQEWYKMQDMDTTVLNGGLPYIKEDEWFQEDGYVHIYGAYAYDATIMLGLAACQEVSKQDTTNSSLVLEGPSYFDTIRRTNFTGVTGFVKLDATTGTRDGYTVGYNIDNMRPYDDPDGDDTKVLFLPTTAYVQEAGSSNWTTKATYIFNGNQTVLGPDPDLPPVQVTLVTIDSWIFGFSMALMSAILLATLGFATWTILYRNSRVVKASQPPFLLLLCFGIAIMALSMVPYSLEHVDIEHTDVTCYAMVYTLTIGFGLTFSALFAKTFRVNAIVHSSVTFRRVQISFRDYVYPVVIMFAINILLLVLLTVFGTIEYGYKAISQEKYGRDDQVLGVCEYHENSFPFIITIVVVNIGMVFLALIQAWRARNLSTEFAESKYIGNALGICFLVALFAYPLRQMTSTNANATTFISVFIISVCAATTLGFIFVPKVLFQRKSKGGGSGGRIRVTGTSFVVGAVSSERESCESDNPNFERILTTKPQKLLAAENKALEKELDAKTKQTEKLSAQNLDLLQRLEKLEMSRDSKDETEEIDISDHEESDNGKSSSLRHSSSTDVWSTQSHRQSETEASELLKIPKTSSMIVENSQIEEEEWA